MKECRKEYKWVRLMTGGVVPLVLALVVLAVASFSNEGWEPAGRLAGICKELAQGTTEGRQALAGSCWFGPMPTLFYLPLAWAFPAKSQRTEIHSIDQSGRNRCRDVEIEIGPVQRFGAKGCRVNIWPMAIQLCFAKPIGIAISNWHSFCSHHFTIELFRTFPIRNMYYTMIQSYVWH